MEIGSRFLHWRSKLVHTMNRTRFRKWRFEAASHNGDPKTVHTLEVYK